MADVVIRDAQFNAGNSSIIHPPEVAGGDIPVLDETVTPYDFGATGNGVTLDTNAFQKMMDYAVANNVGVIIPKGNFACGQVTVQTQNRIEIDGQNGGNIYCKAPTWLKVIAPPGFGDIGGVKINDLRIYAKGGQQVMTPLVWFEGAVTGGLTSLDISDLTFFGDGITAFDCMLFRGCFNGKVSRIWGWSLQASRGIVYDDNVIQSGNFHFDTICLADAAIAMVLVGRGATGFLEMLLSNIKCVRAAIAGDAAPYANLTLTAAGNIGDGTLTVSLADAAGVAAKIAANSPQWAVLADINNADQPNKITAANGATGVLTLARPLNFAMANGTIFGVGTFGIVIMGNARNHVLLVPHFEQVGCGLYCSTAQGVKVIGPLAGANTKRGMVLTNGSQHVHMEYPIYQPSNNNLTLAEITAQGANAWNQLQEPLVSGGGGNAIVWSNAGGNTNQLINDRVNGVGSSITMDGLAAVQAAAFALQNTLPATAGVPVQMPGGMALDGNAWNTVALASQKSRYLIVNLPASGNPIASQLVFYSSDNGGAFVQRAFISNAGIISAAGLFAGGGTGTGTVSAANLEPAGAAAQTIGTSANSTSLTQGRNAGLWTQNSQQQTGMPLKVGNAIASAGVIAPTAPVTHITGVAAIATITPPAAMAQAGGGGRLTLIPDGLWTWTAAGNIAIAGAAVVGKALDLTYDNATAKWYPSYTA